MAKGKRIVSYRDDNIIRNGTTTIVYGTTRVEAKGVTLLNLEKVVNHGFKLLNGGHGVTKGVSKLHPDDEYDQLKGKMVASKKAELKGLKVSRELLVQYIGELETTLGDIQAELKRIDERRDSLLNQGA